MSLPETRVVLRDFDVPLIHKLSVYREHGGYAALEKILKTESTRFTPDGIINEIKASNLRGRGGAGFPTGMKWSFVPKDSPKPKYVVCNADESEPGTFKDRFIIQTLPHQIIEGMIIAGRALNSHQGFIYIRGEFFRGWQRLEAAIREAYEAGLLGKNIMGSGFDFDLVTYRGAGAYICGEETALIESLEGKRGHPRLKPPFPATNGLYDSPTVLNNVETFCSVPAIIRDGAAWYASLGKGSEKSGGTKVYSISGSVTKPGLYEVSLGVPLREIIELAGGLHPGRSLKAVVPGGSSTPVLTAEEAADAIMDYEGMAAKGTFLGSGGLMILDDTVDMVEYSWRVAAFYAKESCGQCTPCREGSRWTYDVLTRIRNGQAGLQAIDTLLSFTGNMANGTTICPFADAVVMAIAPIVRKFRTEFEAKCVSAEVLSV